MGNILTGDQLRSVGNKLAEIHRQIHLQQGGYPFDPDELDKFLQRAVEGRFNESPPPRSWREENGVIYFSVTSDGTTGEDWITRLERKGFRVGDHAKQVLRSGDFKPTNSVKTEVAVLKGMLFEDDGRTTKDIRAEADKRKLSKPNAEIACLIREKFTDKEIEQMGLWYIVTMHEPIKDSVGKPDLLHASRRDYGRWMGAYCDGPGSRWGRVDGFAFVVSPACADRSA